MQKLCSLLILAILIFALAGAAPAQKLLADPQAGYTMYAHNWSTLHNGMDVPGGGNYVYFLANSTLFGTPTLGDNVRKCWSPHHTRGGQESTGRGPFLSAWSFTILGNAAIVSGLQTIITVDDASGPSQLSDTCIAPFTSNPFFLTSGIQIPPTNYGLPAGAWGLAFFTGVGAGAPSDLVPYFQLNNGICLASSLIYELQHGYNATAVNQQYLGMVSIDECPSTNAGGLAQGNPRFGQNEWGGIVNNGSVISYTRMVDAPTPPFGGGNFGLLLFPGQSGIATQDGLESYLCVAFTQAVGAGGRSNGTLDGNGQNHIFYGAGGNDWATCATTMGAGTTTNTLDLRTLDYAYGQLNSPGSAAFDAGNDYWVEWYWSTSPLTFACATNAAGAGAPTPYDGQSRPLDYGIAFDFWTNAFNNNPKAQANVKWGSPFRADVITPLNFILLFDGCEPAATTDPIIAGTSILPRGPLFLLSMCNPKAVNILTPFNGPFHAQSLVWGGTRNANGTPGPGSVPIETCLSIPALMKA